MTNAFCLLRRNYRFQSIPLSIFVFQMDNVGTSLRLRLLWIKIFLANDITVVQHPSC